ncbi:MAG: EAL domain-containing protein [Sulfurospirillaceae bacterium]|nr:EAL domain-containing protein [Sulfurospirillaceae bacterium]
MTYHQVINKMRISQKLLLTFILGLLALVSLFVFNAFSHRYFTDRNYIELQFKSIEIAEKKLDYEILHNTFFLYVNQDILNQQIEDIKAMLANFYTIHGMIHKHQQTLLALEEHTLAFDKKIQAIYDFQTKNSVVKNATAAIVTLQENLFKAETTTHPSDRKVLAMINNIAGTILLAKNAQDVQIMNTIHHDIDTLSKYQFENEHTMKLARTALFHFKVIIEAYPQFITIMTQINDPKLMETLNRAKTLFINESEVQLQSITQFSHLLVFLYIISIGLITFFLIKSEKESRLDTLTQLGNRKAYEDRITRNHKSYALILINIKKFKHYNDFYGIHEGDKLLQATAKRILSIPFHEVNPTFYRLGADDFGILFELKAKHRLLHIAQHVLDTFSKEPIMIDGEIRTPSIAVVASSTSPLLETADMVLKSKQQSNPTLYHEGFNLREIIKDNVTKVRELKEALEKNRIVPFYQPIVSAHTHKIQKYEVLARIILADNQPYTIFPYLRIAKESNLYGELTRTIIQQSFTALAHSDKDFSVNISINDILNQETVAMICTMLERYKYIGQRVIFEILESESIEDYDAIRQFITKVRTYGCRIAVDDFGSGYSNFAHILNLSIDIIKIDGSLIKNIDTDAKANTIVETIISFARNASIRTVAEYVHTEAVKHHVENLQVDELQGFYFYEPSAVPINHIN